MTAAETFEVALTVERAWTLMSDVGRVAACVPGARVDEEVEGEWRGEAAGYAGTARVAERDEVDRRLVVVLRGRNGRGGDATRATLTVALQPHGDRTRVEATADAGGDDRLAGALLGGVATGVTRAAAAGDRRAAETEPPAGAGAADMRGRRVVGRAAGAAACVLLGVAAGRLLGRRP
jgi:carbon monoxide dehydrogenase subunit G